MCSFLIKFIVFCSIRVLLNDFNVRDVFPKQKHEFSTFLNKTYQHRSNKTENSARGSCTNLHELARTCTECFDARNENKYYLMAHNKVARTCTNLHGMCTECLRARDIEAIRFDRQVRFLTNLLRPVKNLKKVIIFYCS